MISTRQNGYIALKIVCYMLPAFGNMVLEQIKITVWILMMALAVNILIGSKN
jgi:hypothetical protein